MRKNQKIFLSSSPEEFGTICTCVETPKKKDVKDDIKDNEVSMEFFMEWEIYENLQVFCNKYGKYNIFTGVLG